ncbi:MAG: hypothetical protein ACKOC4_14565 [Planctomycetia bacterium]
MSKRKRPTSFADIRALVRDVEDLIDGGKWSLDRQAAEEWRRCPWAGAGLAVYWVPASVRASLANEPFVFQEKHYRIGESTEIFPSGDEVMHMAEYHAVG